MLINIPKHFHQVKYVGSRIPGCQDQSNLALGANCQVFAYELLKANGLQPENHRSSELWSDENYSVQVNTFQALDILFYSKNGEAFGAHIGVCLGNNKIIHLSQEIGKPETIDHRDLIKRPQYSKFIGAKRILRKCVS